MKEVLYKFKNGEGDEFRLRLVSDSRQFLSEEMSSLVEKEDFELWGIYLERLGNAQKVTPRVYTWALQEVFRPRHASCLEDIGGNNFRDFSKLYCNLKDNSIKKKIAKEFYLPQHIILENWIKCAVVLRNYLVHHARLWNRNFPIIPQTSKPFRKKWLNHQIPVTNKLYPHLCCLQYFLNSIKEDNFFKERLKVLIANHPNVDIVAMGFPADWEKEPLWK